MKFLGLMELSRNDRRKKTEDGLPPRFLSQQRASVVRDFAASVRDSGNAGGLDSFGRDLIEGGFENVASAQPAVP